MKPILITAATCLVIGFASGWMLNSATNDLESIVTHVPTQERTKPTSQPPSSDAPTTPNRSERLQPPTFTPAAESNIEIPESDFQPDRAKWTRLIEVLNLDNDQANSLQQSIEEINLETDPDAPLDLTYEQAGKELQEKINSLLTPEQREAFEQFQQRSIANRIEAKAHQAFAQELGNLDLTPAQREQALDLLRNNLEPAVTLIPASTRLLLQDSILPIGDVKFSEDSVALLHKMRNQGGTNFEDIATIQRAEIDEKMSQYQGILTPGQLERYQAKLQQSLDALNIISPNR